jgi:hypothetical protein
MLSHPLRGLHAGEGTQADGAQPLPRRLSGRRDDGRTTLGERSRGGQDRCRHRDGHRGDTEGLRDHSLELRVHENRLRSAPKCECVETISTHSASPTSTSNFASSPRAYRRRRTLHCDLAGADRGSGRWKRPRKKQCRLIILGQAPRLREISPCFACSSRIT